VLYSTDRATEKESSWSPEMVLLGEPDPARPGVTVRQKLKATESSNYQCI